MSKSTKIGLIPFQEDCCCVYKLFSPLIRTFTDRDDAGLVFDFGVGGLGLPAYLSLYADDQSQPLLARVTLPGVREDTVWPPNAWEKTAELHAHLLSVLKLQQGEQVGLAPFGTNLMTLTTYPSKGAVVGIDVTVHDIIGQPPEPLGLDEAQPLMQSTINIRWGLDLLVTVRSEAVPLQFRFLAAYMIVEMVLKNGDGQWDPRVHTLLAPYEQVILNGRNGEPLARLESLRAGCAHGWRSKRKRKPYTSLLTPNEYAELHRVLPALARVAAQALNLEAKRDLFTMPPIKAGSPFQPTEASKKREPDNG